MSEQKENSHLVMSKISALTLNGPASLAKRGLADLQTRGSAESLFKLAMMFRRRKQYEKSLTFLQRAIALDPQHLEATTWLGVAYSGGRGVERDEARAIRYFREAADRGHAHAQFCLGNCYAQGRRREEEPSASCIMVSEGSGARRRRCAVGTSSTSVPRDRRQRGRRRESKEQERSSTVVSESGRARKSGCSGSIGGVVFHWERSKTIRRAKGFLEPKKHRD
jgi:TPR repeat protein